jgi:hypothetical protein
MSARRKQSSRSQPSAIVEAEKISTTRTIIEPSPDAALPLPEEAFVLISQLQELRQSQLFTFVTVPGIIVRGDVVEQLYEQLHNIGRVPQIDLFLYSTGGETEIPWRLITLIREFCDRFAVLIPAAAYSAATHLAMGADEIVMGPLSELSPVDPARSHPLLPRSKEGELPEPISVQDLRHCVQFIKNEINSEGEISNASPEAMAAIFAALFEKIHPLAIGAIQQSYALARLISTKALSTHMDPEANKEKIEQIVDTLSDKFFSHHYLIARQEAKEIGLNVTDADGQLWETMWALYKHYKAYFTAARAIGNGQAARPIVWIDSIHQRHILEEVLLVADNKPSGVSRWISSPWTQHRTAQSDTE